MAILLRSVWRLQFILPSISPWNKNWSHCSPYCLRTKTNYVVMVRKKGVQTIPSSFMCSLLIHGTLSLHLCNVKMQCHVSNKRGIKLLPFGTASWKRWRLILYAFILLVKMGTNLLLPFLSISETRWNCLDYEQSVEMNFILGPCVSVGSKDEGKLHSEAQSQQDL